MRLKRITLHGFKTFADKTEIEFAPGVTAIVGPNGSGKSNLLDALTWCLGEQKASSVRATRAQDVIFAGSSRRKPMGMAEVSLTVDNEDGFLPLNFSEVTITRRVYRSGEGEYFINKAHCRLKDITDLFLDTGVGRGAYAIVNQNEIDAILSARAEDRRELFEEAAGIKKYRVRKREAQRKLDQTEQNLVRIRDIALEIEGNLAPMEEQALTARRFRELSERLREIEVGLLAADYKRLQDELTELGRMAVDADAEADSQRNEATTLEASASELMARISDAESEMDRARLLQQTALSEGERVEGRIALGRERRAAAIRTVETVELDVAGLAEEKARQEAEAKAFAEAANEAELRLSTLSRELQSAEATAKEAERTLIDLSRAVAGQEADYLELARRLAAQKAELDSLRVRLAERADSLRRAEEATMVRQAESEAAKSDAMRLAQEAESAQASFLEAQRILTQEQQPAYQKAVERANSLSERRVVQERRLTEQAARLRALEETEAAREGYFAGVRSVAQAMQKGQLRGRYQPFADAIRVPAELDTAIEAALGGSLQDIITDTEIEAKTAVAHLRETRGGRATFLPLDVLRDVDVPDALRKSARQYSGVMGSAADLVSFDADVRIAVHLHLARVLLVDDLDTATRVSRQLSNREWSRIVTLTGEVVVPTGAITGGANARSGPNLLGRRREVSDLTESVKSARIALEETISAEANAKAEAETARQQVRDAEITVQQARDAASDAARRHASGESDAMRLSREAENLTVQTAQLAAAMEADATREAMLDAALSVGGQQDDSALATREELNRRQAALMVARDNARDIARPLTLEQASLRERLRGLQRDGERAREAALRAVMSAEERAKRAEEARTIIAFEDAQIPEREAERERAKKSLADATALLDKWRERRQALLNENFQLTERIRAARHAVERATIEAQSARLRVARVEAQRDAIGQRLLDEYELHPDSAVALTGGVPVDRDTAQEIGRLRREIRSLGTVNVGAIEEFERLSERWKFLSEQRADLEEAKTRLNVAIAEIDASTKGVFEETFVQVEAAFARLFGRLFGGGTAQLELTNPDDILETGVEIIAQPPGKKRQNLALLSGGERALTACALLFAFLEVRPAPFCVLDEVDAPLDGANVEKFADLLRYNGQESQFIVITHNVTTMEAAPLWYGVTMQEPGVSRGLSMRVPESTVSVPDQTDQGVTEAS